LLVSQKANRVHEHGVWHKYNIFALLYERWRGNFCSWYDLVILFTCCISFQTSYIRADNVFRRFIVIELDGKLEMYLVLKFVWISSHLDGNIICICEASVVRSILL